MIKHKFIWENNKWEKIFEATTKIWKKINKVLTTNWKFYTIW